MIMKKKNLILAATAAAMIAAMTGCSGGAEETTAAETTAAETTAAETEAEETEAEETTAAEAEETEAAGEETEAAEEAGAENGTLEAVANMSADGELAQIIEAGKIVLGTSPDFAPWEFQDISSGTTEYVGSDIELAKYIAQRLGVELEIKPMEFGAILQALASDTIDMGISGFAYTEERAEAAGLSDPYNQNSAAGQGILVLKDQTADYNTAETFAGKKIAAQNASLQMQLVQAQLPADVEIQPVTTVSEGVLMLINGRVDAVAVSGDNGLSLSESYPEVAMAEFKFDYENDGNVVAVKKSEEELLGAINEIMADVNSEGLYEQWKADAVELAQSLGIETN